MQKRRNNLILRVVAMVFTAATISSCIKNDAPLPTIKGEIVSLEVENQKGNAVIDPQARTVVIDLQEVANPASVIISKVELCETGTSEVLIEGAVLDLTSPRKVIIKTVAEYEWTISATQSIERYFVINDQVGEAHFEVYAKNVFAYVPKGTDLTAIKVSKLKLGPEGSVIEPNLVEKESVSFRASSRGDDTKVCEVEVSYRGITETWSLFVTETDTQINKLHAFAGRVYLTGYGQEGLENGFQYKPVEEEPEETGRLVRSGENDEDGEEEGNEPDEDGWYRVPDEQVEHNGGVFTTILTGLTPNTTYIVRAFSGTNFSPEQTFTTEGTRELPGGSFDTWHQSGKVWNPWPEGGEQWWDTGNKGATTLGDSNSVPTDAGEGCPLNPEGKAAYLQTKFVGMMTAGKIAGGNIYFGQYGKTSGTNGTVNMGWPWQYRPTKLKGWYKYTPKEISDVGTLLSSRRSEFMGKSDTLNVVVALWASPDGQTRQFEENTDPDKFVTFTEDTPGVIAYGAFSSAVEQTEWMEFTLDIDYKTTAALPSNTVMLIMATASKYANYFTGGRGSTLYLDELSLIYD